MNRTVPSLLAAGLVAAPACALAQSVEELQIRAWRETYENAAWAPNASARLKSNGDRAGLVNTQCTAFAAGSVSMMVERKANSKNPVSAYRGQSGAYCAPKGVGLIEFADGGRWLGEVTNRFNLLTNHLLPYPNGLGELRKADGSSQILRVKDKDNGAYGWEVLQVVASSTATAGDVTRPVAWLTRPAPADWARLRPATGEGRVVLTCAIASAGGIDCASQDPAEPALEAAALALSRLYRVDMTAEKDRIGYSFKLPFRFDPPVADGS